MSSEDRKESDLSFAEFGAARDDSRRLYTSPESEDDWSESRKRPDFLVGRVGIEPTTSCRKPAETRGFRTLKRVSRSSGRPPGWPSIARLV